LLHLSSGEFETDGAGGAAAGQSAGWFASAGIGGVNDCKII